MTSVNRDCLAARTFYNLIHQNGRPVGFKDYPQAESTERTKEKWGGYRGRADSLAVGTFEPCMNRDISQLNGSKLLVVDSGRSAGVTLQLKNVSSVSGPAGASLQELLQELAEKSAENYQQAVAMLEAIKAKAIKATS